MALYLAAITLLVGAGYAVCYLGLRRTLRRAISERHEATESQLNALAVTLKLLEDRVAELSRNPELQAAAAPAMEMDAEEPPAEEAVDRGNEEVTPEIMAVLAASASAFLGKKVRILSARLLEAPPEATNAWSQQGRVFVQASHNLWSRG